MSAGFTYFSPPPAAACEDMDSPQYVPFDNTPPLVQLESSEGCRKVETENFFCFINREMKKLQKKVEEMPPGYYHVDYNYITSLFSNSNTFKESFLFPDSSATNIAKLHTASKSRAISVASPFSNFTKKIPSESFSRSSITRQPCSLLQWSTKASETDEAPLPAVMTHHKHFLMDDLPVEQGADVIADGDAGFCQKPLSYSEALKEVAHVTPQQDYDKSSPPVTPLLPSSYYQSKNRTGCRFCWRNNEPPAVYTSHNLHDSDTGRIVTCPVLLRHVCEMCGATGVQAHTRSHCPISRQLSVGRNTISTTLAIKSTYRQSNGEARKPCRNMFPGI
ncbi:uncharacterized protein LOC134533070 isoform X1 [Bacillus rossius redtenbacheri]|uniref:uncharacterized protein LOC134533070 isoform X1 n=1 Tax=Bacillus rossius redtenbacheri TaxID=93214 RepID=UPI002FDDF555